MMRQMRENTKWIMLVTALAFVALMVFEWGMDITGQSLGALGEIGSVNGTPVYYEDYQVTMRNLFDQMQSAQEEPLTSQQSSEIEDAAWDQLVNSILVQQELERRGIRVTDEEVLQAAMTQPPPFFYSAPEFQTDGVFDITKYQAFVQSPQVDENTLLYLETYYRDQIPRVKLQRQLLSGLYPTDAELWRRYQDENETVQVRFLTLDPEARVPDDEIEISDREVRQYYRENEDEFAVPAQAEVRGVVLTKTPTAADTAAALELANEIRQEILDDADFAEVAQRDSDDAGSAEGGGDLGTVTPGALTDPLDEIAFSAPVGQVTEPARSSAGYHLVEVTNRWAADSASLRHILIEIDRTDASEMALLTAADSLEDLSEDLGLVQAAEEMGVEVVEATVNSNFPFLPGAGQIGEGADWLLEEALPGDVSPVFENSVAFYALELISSTPAGTLPLDEARGSIEQRLRAQAKLERTETEAEALVERIRGGQDLAAVGEELGIAPQTAGPFSRSDFVPGLGRMNAAVGAAFGLRQGEVSDPVAAGGNVHVIQLLGSTAADSAAWEAQKQVQRSIVIQSLQSERLDLWLEGLREQARIVDRREQVLQPVEDQPLRPTGGFGF